MVDLRIPGKSKTRVSTTQTRKSPNQFSKGSIERKKTRKLSGNSTSKSNRKSHKKTSVKAVQNLENVDEWAG
jgi:hypothetical protein